MNKKFNIRTFEIVMSDVEFSWLKKNQKTRLYQMKWIDSDSVRVYTDRPDSMVKDFSLVLNESKDTVAKRFGLIKEDQDAA